MIRSNSFRLLTACLVLFTWQMLVVDCTESYADTNEDTLNMLAIIAHKDVPASGLTRIDLERVFLGKKSLWSDDTTIVPVIHKAGPTHEVFVEEYLDRPIHRFVTYWRQVVFTGKGVPPKAFANEQELVDFVAQTPGAIGYVSSDFSTTGVKELIIRR